MFYEKAPSSALDNDPAAVIAASLKRTPGAGRERIVDPDNLTSPACAPEAYGGAGNGDAGSSNPITGEPVRSLPRRACLRL